MGEIALAVLKMKVRKEGIRSFEVNDEKRDVGRQIEHPELKKVEVTKEELLAFGNSIFTEVFNNWKEEMYKSN